MKFFSLGDDRSCNGVTYEMPWFYANEKAEDVIKCVSNSFRRKFDGDCWGAPDLVRCDMHEEAIEDGEHPCTLYGVDCTLFTWTQKELSTGWTFGPSGTEGWRKHIRRGLVCVTTDTKACEYARSKMKERCAFL